jgi:hypothetical protein
MDRRIRMGNFGRMTVVFMALLVVSAGIWGGAIPAAGDAEKGIEKGSDVIIIDNTGYKKDRRGPVTFTHKKHALDYRVSCWDCHHEYVDGNNAWVPWEATDSCDTCHDPVEKQDNAMKLQTAFHVNCKNCHKDLAKQNKKSGPYRKCLECHKKQ